MPKGLTNYEKLALGEIRRQHRLSPAVLAGLAIIYAYLEEHVDEIKDIADSDESSQVEAAILYLSQYQEE